MHGEDPYVSMYTQPCAPWGSWSRSDIAKDGKSAETVLEKREQHRPILKGVNDSVVDRMARGRHVFLEEPLWLRVSGPT